MQPVLVGVDGSPASVAAAEYAAAMAQRRRAPLHLVHACQLDLRGHTLSGLSLGETSKQRNALLAGALADLAHRLRAQHPDLVEVQAHQVHRAPAGLLIERSASALATVVGYRGDGGFADLILGSVSTQVAAHASGPVVVVRPRRFPKRRDARGCVLVGLDDSLSSRLALDFAATEAAQREAQLIVAHVHNGTDEDAKQLLVDSVDPWAAGYHGLSIELRPIDSANTDYALVEASRHVDLTVVGSRGLGGFASLALGSVSRTLVQHAYGPVAVVHARHG